MPRISLPFVGQAYRARSLNVDAQRCLNLYLEADASSTKTPAALYCTPGLTLLGTAGAGPHRGAWLASNGVLYVVSGNKLYEVSKTWVATERGTLTTGIGPVRMADNGLQLMVVDGTNGYILPFDTLAFGQITDPEFPPKVSQLVYQDGYFIVPEPGSGRFWISALYNGLDWDGVDFASAEGQPDNVIAALTDHRELWLFGDVTTEVWFNTGNADFPFERSANTFIEIGTAAQYSAAKMANTVFWLGQAREGGVAVFSASGYQPQRISTHAIERAIESYARIDDAEAITYTQEGHPFYCLSFPTAGKCWAFDVASGAWHERASMEQSTGDEILWRTGSYAFYGVRHVVGDRNSGKLFALDLDNFTEDGDRVLRLRSGPTTARQNKRVRYASLEIDIEGGVGNNLDPGQDPQMMLRFSDDGGHTWSSHRYTSMGKIGEKRARAHWNRCGMGRNRVFEVSVTDPVKAAILGAYIEAEEMTS